MNTILVTGGTGFLGRTIVESLLKQGDRVRYTVRAASPAICHHQSDTEIVVGDLLDEEFVKRAIRGVDAIVHTAAKLGGWGPKELFLSNNVVSTENLLQAAAPSVSRIVFVSSATSYGRQPGTVITERTPTRAERDPYCSSKRECEQLVRLHCDRYGTLGTILRPAIIFGPYDRRFFIPILQHMQNGTMVAIGKKNQGPPLVFAADVARFVGCVLKHQTMPFEIFNLCSPEKISWEEIVRFLGKNVDLSTSLPRIPYGIAYSLAAVMELLWKIARSSHPPMLTRFLVGLIGQDYSFDCTKALSVPGFDGFTPHATSFEKTLEWALSEQGVFHRKQAMSRKEAIHEFAPAA